MSPTLIHDAVLADASERGAERSGGGRAGGDKRKQKPPMLRGRVTPAVGD